MKRLTIVLIGYLAHFEINAAQTLTVATFNVLNSFDGSRKNERYIGDRGALNKAVKCLGELDADIVGLQEVHDYGNLETVARALGRKWYGAKTHRWYIYPPAILSRYEIVDSAYFVTDGATRLVTMAGIRLPTNDTLYAFSIHLSFEKWGKTHSYVVSQIVQEKMGRYPVLIFGDYNGKTNRFNEDLDGMSSVLYSSGIDAILGSRHFTPKGKGKNHGKCGFSDHPLLSVSLSFTPPANAAERLGHVYKSLDEGETWSDMESDLEVPENITGIEIRRPPARGTLSLKGKELGEGDLVTARDFGNLSYIPKEIGKDNFKWRPVMNGKNLPDVFAFTTTCSEIKNLRFGGYNNPEQPSNGGYGYIDFGKARPGAPIYSHLDADKFTEALPADLRGITYHRNGQGNSIMWGNEYLVKFTLPTASRIFLAVGERAADKSRPSPAIDNTWTRHGDPVVLNTAKPDYRYTIYRKDFSAGEAIIKGNATGYDQRTSERNLVIFVKAQGAVGLRPSTPSVRSWREVHLFSVDPFDIQGRKHHHPFRYLVP